jgi:AraC-like DNA-binding protein
VPAKASVSVLLLRPLAAMLVGSRPALDAFYAATDLTSELIVDDDARVSHAQFSVAWSEALRLTGDPALALQIAGALPSGSFGIVEYVCRSASTVGEAVRQWVRYLNILDEAVHVGVVQEGESFAIRVLDESEAPAPSSHELCFGVIAARARELVATPFRLLGVRFTHRAPPDIRLYEQWFSAPVTFGARYTELVLARSAMEAPLSTADPNLLAILTRHADLLARKDRSKPPVTREVERILRAALRNDAGEMDPIAKRLGLTPRSLQRRLKEEGTSFKEVREEVRRELAMRYLDDNLSIAEVSFLLGFSEPSAFFRAFKRWTGVTPLENRAQRRLSMAVP